MLRELYKLYNKNWKKTRNGINAKLSAHDLAWRARISGERFSFVFMNRADEQWAQEQKIITFLRNKTSLTKEENETAHNMLYDFHDLHKRKAWITISGELNEELKKIGWTIAHISDDEYELTYRAPKKKKKRVRKRKRKKDTPEEIVTSLQKGIITKLRLHGGLYFDVVIQEDLENQDSIQRFKRDLDEIREKILETETYDNAEVQAKQQEILDEIGVIEEQINVGRIGDELSLEMLEQAAQMPEKSALPPRPDKRKKVKKKKVKKRKKKERKSKEKKQGTFSFATIQ